MVSDAKTVVLVNKLTIFRDVAVSLHDFLIKLKQCLNQGSGLNKVLNVTYKKLSYSFSSAPVHVVF